MVAEAEGAFCREVLSQALVEVPAAHHDELQRFALGGLSADAAGEKAAHSYTIELERVRLYDPDNEPEPIQCPLYTKLTEAEKEQRLKQSLWNREQNKKMQAAWNSVFNKTE